MDTATTITPGLWAMTGAAGNIGRHLRETLGPSFEQLLLLDIEPIDNLAPHEQAQRLDLRDFEAVSSALAGVEGIIHLGGLADEADFPDLAEVNIVGTYHLLEAARLQSVRRVIYASSNRATGFYPTDHTVRPDEPFRLPCQPNLAPQGRGESGPTARPQRTTRGISGCSAGSRPARYTRVTGRLIYDENHVRRHRDVRLDRRTSITLQSATPT